MEKKKALVIDDEQIVLDSVRKILEPAGFSVFTTCTGGSGICHAINEPYDVVLTDIRMPRIDGYKVIRDIRRFNNRVPIVIITGYASIGSAVEAMKLGASSYIEKPFTPEQLLATVTGAIEGAAGALPEDLTLIHPALMAEILKRGATDAEFAKRIFDAAALDEYNLTAQEKLCLVTGDIAWIEDQMGVIPREQKQWLTERRKDERPTSNVQRSTLNEKQKY